MVDPGTMVHAFMLLSRSSQRIAKAAAVVAYSKVRVA